MALGKALTQNRNFIVGAVLLLIVAFVGLFAYLQPATAPPSAVLARGAALPSSVTLFINKPQLLTVDSKAYVAQLISVSFDRKATISFTTKGGIPITTVVLAAGQSTVVDGMVVQEGTTFAGLGAQPAFAQLQFGPSSTSTTATG